MKNDLYHYTECGLDNVWLVNGFQKHDTPYGEGISITNAAGLHKAIARSIIERAGEMTGAEFRFLRLELDLSQHRLATFIKADEQAVRRWEKARHKPVKGVADIALRVLYKSFSAKDGEVRRMLETLAELDAKAPPDRIVMRDVPKRGWRLEAA